MAESDERCGLKNETVLELVDSYMADWALADLAPVRATSRALCCLVKSLPVTICFQSIWHKMFVTNGASYCEGWAALHDANAPWANVEAFGSLCSQYTEAAVIDTRMPSPNPRTGRACCYCMSH